MAIIGISITKETAFRDSVQPFSNMYFYNNGTGGQPDQTGASSLIDELVAIEKTLHSSSVEFTYGRCWVQGLTELTSFMIHQKPLVGNGTAASVTMDKERAYLFRRRAGEDERGQPVYLRKWYHTCGTFPGLGAAPSTGVMANSSGFTDTERTNMANAMQGIHGLASAGGGWVICAKSGRGPTSPGAWTAHRYLEHHQLGDQWRGA